MINIAGNEIKIINIDGSADWKKCAWLTKSYVKVASVSKLKGLSIKVRGSSFEISINTIKEVSNKGFFKMGKLIFNEDFKGVPFKFLDAWLILVHCFFILDLMGCQATAKKRTRYAKTRPKIDPIITILEKSLMELFNFRIPIAIIAPGIEYPNIAN